MKIDNQNPAVPYTGNGRADRPEAAELHGETVAKQQAATDKVELSRHPSLAPVAQVADPARVKQVAEIKARIDSGSYHVSGMAIAEKMLSRILGGVAQPATAGAV